MNSQTTEISKNKLRFGLSEGVIRDLRNIFSQFENVNQVILFGSRAIGKFRSGSDIDFAVDAENLCYNSLLDIQLKIDELDLLYKIDLVALEKQKGTSLGDQIHKTGKIFYQKQKNVQS